jgi:hypothetical protein
VRGERIARARRTLPQLALGSLASKRQEVFLLCCDEIGRVDLDQRLALLDRIARLVDVDPLHPSGEAEVDDRDLVFAHRDLADAPQVPKYRLPTSRLDPHSHVLDHDGIDRDSARSRLARCLLLVDRDQIHPHRRLPGLVRDVPGIHRCDPVLDLSLSGGALRRGLGRRASTRTDGRQIHAADRAGARALMDHLRVHAAGVELGARRGLPGRFQIGRRDLLSAGDQQERKCQENRKGTHHG